MDAAGGLFGGEDFGRTCLSGAVCLYSSSRVQQIFVILGYLLQWPKLGLSHAKIKLKIR
jgi:hypothetical protein